MYLAFSSTHSCLPATPPKKGGAGILSAQIIQSKQDFYSLRHVFDREIFAVYLYPRMAASLHALHNSLYCLHSIRGPHCDLGMYVRSVSLLVPNMELWIGVFFTVMPLFQHPLSE